VSLYLSILSVLLLATVAGLLMAVWFQLRDWKTSVREAPLLAERLAEQMLSARRGLEELRRALVGHGPELSQLISDGGKLRVELQFLLQRAEQMSVRTEAQVRHKAGGPQLTVVEQVAGANGKAVQPSTTAHDPLEDLLAGLQEATEPLDNVMKISSSTRPRSGRVTQAELDLQQKMARG